MGASDAGYDAGNLVLNTGVAERYPSWSPGSDQLVYWTDTDDDIHRINRDGTGDTNLTNTVADDERDPHWSPVANTIVFASDLGGDYDIFTMSTAATTYALADRVHDGAANDRYPFWSVEGTMIHFTSDDGGGDLEIYSMTSAGGSLTNLTENATGDFQQPD